MAGFHDAVEDRDDRDVPAENVGRRIGQFREEMIDRLKTLRSQATELDKRREMLSIDINTIERFLEGTSDETAVRVMPERY